LLFKVLSHAGLLVEDKETQLISDPWVRGSCYWRSWWNYPPVEQELINSLKPDYIYLTHIHWDHFQSPSLKLFSPDTHFLIPKGNNDRIKRDLNYLGFKNITELKHGESFQLNQNLELTSYQFDVRLDSAIVLKNQNVTLLNLNDCKIMGLPLQQILKAHKNIDFVFCGHSSANSRLCYEIMDDENATVDDINQYIKNFSYFARATGSRYAVPFASNVCHLHDDTFKYNEFGQTPLMVEKYWEENNINQPELKVMVSGDSWSEDEGFNITHKDWYTDRDQKLLDYKNQNSDKLKSFQEMEDQAQLSLEELQNYFSEFRKTVPFIIRRLYKKHPFVFVLKTGKEKLIYQANLCSGLVKKLDLVDDKSHPFQIHTSAYILKNCIEVSNFTHLGISKRVRFRVTSKEEIYSKGLELLFDLYEYEVLPFRKNFSPRSLETWLLRWREIILYIDLAKDLLTTKKLDIEKQLPPHLA